MTKPEVADPVNKLQRNFIKINNMKKLSKLHLRSEQYLTDSEMKLISGGTDEKDYYYDCGYDPFMGHSTGYCLVNYRCTKHEPGPPGTGSYIIQVGSCQSTFENGVWGCECRI